MAEKKALSEKEIGKKIVELKIELLRDATKRGRVKKEIARLLTMANRDNRKLKIENRKDSGNNALTKLTEEVK